MRRLLVIGALICGMGLVGCGGDKVAESKAPDASQPSQHTQAAANANAAEPGKPVAVPATAKPEQVMAAFLDALKAGDQATTASLLTQKALDETSKRQLSVCPEATPHMQYEISQAKVLADNPHGAHVAVRWTEKYQDGDVSYDVTWVLRKQPEGWRIAGMAMELIPGQGQEFLNFEDPDDMLAKQEAAMAAMEPAIETAALPEFGQDAGASGVIGASGEVPETFSPGAGNQFQAVPQERAFSPIER